MNYLAHIFLSGNDSQLQIGNFIGDFVKGTKLNTYPTRIREGISLHRKIDSFTDSHPVVRETVAILRPTFGRYSGIIADMYFDYFLAINFYSYASNKSLRIFAFRFYVHALINYRHLPERVRGFIFHFITTNRLHRYSTMDGLKKSLTIMANYKISAIKPQETIDFLIDNHTELEKLFHQFFPDLMEVVKQENL